MTDADDDIAAGIAATAAEAVDALDVEGLVGLDVDLSGGLGTAPQLEADTQKFASFALEIVLPPNPVRALDNSLTGDQQAGKNFSEGTRRADGLPASFDGPLGAQAGFRCEGCHRLDESQLDREAYQGGHAVVAEPSRVDPRRDEAVPQRVHLDQRR